MCKLLTKNIFKKIQKYHDHSYMSFKIDAIPMGKSLSDKTFKHDVQMQIINTFKQCCYEKLSRNIKVAVSISTCAVNKKSESIEIWVKNLLDILHKNDYGNDADYNYLPIEDDDQIVYLNAYCCYMPEKSGDESYSDITYIKIIPFKSFQKDCSFIIKHKLYENQNNSFINNKFSEKELEELRKEAQTSYPNLIDKKGNKVNVNKLNKWIHKDYKVAYQSEYLKSYLINRNVLANYLKKGKLHKIILSTDKIIKLDGIPYGITTNTSLRQNYKQHVKDKLQDFKNQHPVIDKIYYPVKISVIFQPRHDKSRIKDVDNIIRELLVESVNEVLCPPAIPGGIDFLNSEDSVTVNQDLANKLNKHLNGYEVLQIPSKHSEPEGNVYLCINNEIHHDDLIKSNRKLLEAFFKENNITFLEGINLEGIRICE